MKKKPAISVIIPVYNSELYIKECIDSLLKQTFNDIEILIIDDGSTDSSWKFIQHLSSLHTNIHAFKQERNRQGAARNLGLSRAQGEYISFVDSDDMLPKDAYHTMYTLAKKHDSDLTIGIKKSFDKERKWLPGRQLNWITIAEHKEFFTAIRPNIQLEDLPELLVDISVCNKLIRHSLLKNKRLRFVENSAGEDIDFMTRLYAVANGITIIPQVVYHYCSRPSSRTSRIQPEFFEDRVQITEDLESTLQPRNNPLLYRVLVTSELRKLVNNRLSRVIQHSPYDEQLIIFKTIRRLLEKIGEEGITDSVVHLSPLTKIRLLMLFHEEFDALIAFTLRPQVETFFHLLSEQTRKQLTSPLKEYRLETQQLNSISLTSIANLRVRVYTILSKYRSLLASNKIFTKKNLAIIYYLLLQPCLFFTHKNKRKSNIWLIDERVSTSAQDNSFAFFKYLKTNHPKVAVYYVIDKHSPDLPKLSPFKSSVVFQYSLKHAYLLGVAKVLLSTDRFSSLAYPYTRLPLLRRDTHNVFLQHGVAGNKTMTYSKKNYPYFSQVIVSNNIEKEFFIQEYGFTKKEVTVTGIARFDNLSPNPDKSSKKSILIAPTWRQWLQTPQRVAASRYLYFWNQLMTNCRLDTLAQEHNVTFYFRPHFNMIPFLEDFTTNSNNIIILTEHNLFLQKYIKESALLITDYSSVMYDFFFQKKPVICYMFDRRHWEVQPPGPPHINYDQDLPVNIATTSDEVIDFLSDSLENDCEMSKEQRRGALKFFSYLDNHNSERIYHSILNLTTEERSQ